MLRHLNKNPRSKRAHKEKGKQMKKFLFGAIVSVCLVTTTALGGELRVKTEVRHRSGRPAVIRYHHERRYVSCPTVRVYTYRTTYPITYVRHYTYYRYPYHRCRHYYPCYCSSGLTLRLFGQEIISIK